MTTTAPLRAMAGRATAWARDPLPWAIAGLLLLAAGLPRLEPAFAALFPSLDRPMYRQDTFLALLGAHVALVAASSAVALALGFAAGLFVTHPAGAEFRALVETAVAISQTVPPVAVLAVAAPLIGFGEWPALIALALYGLLPILRGTIAGIESVPPAVLDAATGLDRPLGLERLQDPGLLEDALEELVHGQLLRERLERLHRPVEIEMVLREVREGSYFEAGSGDPAHLQGM